MDTLCYIAVQATDLTFSATCGLYRRQPTPIQFDERTLYTLLRAAWGFLSMLWS